MGAQAVVRGAWPPLPPLVVTAQHVGIPLRMNLDQMLYAILLFSIDQERLQCARYAQMKTDNRTRYICAAYLVCRFAPYYN